MAPLSRQHTRHHLIGNTSDNASNVHWTTPDNVHPTTTLRNTPRQYIPTIIPTTNDTTSDNTLGTTRDNTNENTSHNTSDNTPNIHLSDKGAISKFTFSGDRRDSTPVTMESSMVEADFGGKGLGVSGAIMVGAFLPKCT
jgi:hypothetical protein